MKQKHLESDIKRIYEHSFFRGTMLHQKCLNLPALMNFNDIMFMNPQKWHFISDEAITKGKKPLFIIILKKFLIDEYK